MIKVFTPENIIREKVIELWKHSFGDSAEYINFFLDECPDYLCIADIVDNSVVSMFFLLEGELAGEKSKYLYAACTHTDFRKKGLMSGLINYAIAYCKDQGYSSIFLVPANPELYSYYAKFGFIPSFRKKVLRIKNSEENTNTNYCTTDIEKILKLKRRLQNKVDGFQFSADVTEYTIKEHLYNGGEIHLLNDDTLFFTYYNDKSLVVKEYLTEKIDNYDYLYNFFVDKSTENIYISTPIVYNNKDIVGEYTKCGMALPLCNELMDYLEMHQDLYASMYLD